MTETPTVEVDEEVAELRRVAERAKERARASGLLGTRSHGEPFDAKKYLATMNVPMRPESVADERAPRIAEAVAIRGMLPPFLRSGTADQLKARVPEKAFLEAALNWRWGGGNLLLLGSTGLGKSTAAAILFRWLLQEGVRLAGKAWSSARFMAWFGAADLLAASREHPFGKGEAPDCQRACRASLLVLDDAGWDRDPGPCSLVLDERYRCGLPTVITSGKTEPELVAHYGAAVVRRMTETGGAALGGEIWARFPESGA
jgi:hypothetical protein